MEPQYIEQPQLDFIDYYTAIRGICCKDSPNNEQIQKYLNNNGIKGEIKNGEIVAYGD